MADLPATNRIKGYRSTDGGATFAWTVLPIIQRGTSSSAQAGRGLFCIHAGGSSFRLTLGYISDDSRQNLQLGSTRVYG